MIVLAVAAAAAQDVNHPDAFLHASQVVDLGVLLAAVVVLGRQLRRRDTPATRWALTMFGVFALIVASGFLGIDKDDSTATHLFTLTLISLLLLIPYSLVRFACALRVLGASARKVATALTAVQIVATWLLPRFPAPGENRSGWFTAYISLILLGWTVQSVMSALALWKTGNGQPSVVRHRMRALSLGAVTIVVALLSSAGSSNPSVTAQVISTLIGVVGVLLTVAAFVVPTWLRAAWRADDLTELGVAERSLMTALTPDEVGFAIVPAIVALFGANGAALLDQEGVVIEARGMTPEGLSSVRALVLAEPADAVITVMDDAFFTCRLSQGWLVLQAGVFAPLFGPTELALLDRVGSFVDLALQRCRLFEQEARSRHAAESATAELQTIVYSVSHDLRNPIISVLGYLDVLRQEHTGELTGEGPHYLERISVNAIYMQNLIQDLLELSRIGRSEPASQAVPMGSLAESVAQEVRIMHPACDISVDGTFPVVWMSDLRARQLLSNLIDNAAKHAGHDASVEVRAMRDDAGGALLLISDNGAGIPAQYREKAFEVFERLEAARSDIPGTGMGLPICKRIVESLSGTITLEGPRETASTGTTVRISFPAATVRTWTDVIAPQKETVR
ncbi:MAG: Phytochrome, two-component sensor histidine kinase [Frankiales bacterium]|nr:Phytochrome, two-component sensor histidine kinase [Frankiales bacterium]